MERVLNLPPVPGLVKSQREDLNLGSLAPEAGPITRKPHCYCDTDTRGDQGGVGTAARGRLCHPTPTGCQTVVAGATSHGLGGSRL